MDESYLITNRSIIFERDKNKEVIADKVVFSLKKIIGKWEKLKWKNIELNHDELLDWTKIFEELSIDIVAIRVEDLLSKGIKEDMMEIQTILHSRA